MSLVEECDSKPFTTKMNSKNTSNRINKIKIAWWLIKFPLEQLKPKQIKNLNKSKVLVLGYNFHKLKEFKASWKYEINAKYKYLIFAMIKIFMLLVILIRKPYEMKKKCLNLI
jgi:hypothetical protein